MSLLADVLNGASRVVRTLTYATVSSIAEISAEIEGSDYRLLYSHLYLGPGLSLLTEERYSEERVLDRLEGALRDGAFVERICVELDASSLGDIHRERAEQGVRGLLKPGTHWTLACDQLHRALEGALWDAAISENVIDADRYFIGRRSDGRRGPRAQQPAHLLSPDGGLSMDPYLRRLLRNRIFDGSSHEIRHGRAGADTRRYALESSLALLGWLDRGAEEPSAVPLLAARINELEGARLTSDAEFEQRYEEPSSTETAPALTLGMLLPPKRTVADQLAPPATTRDRS